MEVRVHELCHSFLSTLSLLSVGRKAFTKLSEKGFVITSIRRAMACLFCTDSCKIRLLGRIICFLPLRFTYKHTDEKCFQESRSPSASRYILFQVVLNQMEKETQLLGKQKGKYSVVSKQKLLPLGNIFLLYGYSC